MSTPPNLIRTSSRVYGTPAVRWWVACLRCGNGHLITVPKQKEYLAKPWPCGKCRKKANRREWEAAQQERAEWRVGGLMREAPKHVPPIQDIR